MPPRFTINENTFLNEDEVSYYLLGVYMSDGCIYSKRNRFEITSKDVDWIEKIRNTLCTNKSIYITKDGHAQLQITNKIATNWLKVKGCLDRKSLILKWPDVPEKYLPDFIRGYFDGDGSVSLSKYNKIKNNKTYTYTKLSCYICSANELFIKDLSIILHKHNLNHCVFKTKNKENIIKNRKIKAGTMWRVSFGDRTALKFLNWIYYDNHLISMPRKFQKINDARNYFLGPGDGMQTCQV